jgi:hypothetical protein
MGELGPLFRYLAARRYWLTAGQYHRIGEVGILADRDDRGRICRNAADRQRALCYYAADARRPT